MNNKLFARIAAAAIGVSMLATVAFAAPVATKDDQAQTGLLSFVVDGSDISESTEAQITMMAYLVDEKDSTGTAYTTETAPAYDGTQEIVALDQVAGADGFGDVAIDYAKLATGKVMVVKLGGSDGTVDTFLVAYNKAAQTVEFTYGDATEDKSVTTADVNAIKVYLRTGTHPRYSKINTGIVDGSKYVYGDATEDANVTTADVNAIKVYLRTGTHPRYTKINTTEEVVAE